MLFASGILLGIAVLASVLSMHFGPHSHFVSLAAGGVSIAILIAMIATQGGDETIYFILGVDLAIVLGVGFLLKHGFSQKSSFATYNKPSLVSGIAISDLNPIGVVQAGGELWSATSVAGTIKAGSKVDVISSTPVRLEVVATDQVLDPFSDSTYGLTVAKDDQPPDATEIRKEG